MYLIFGGRFPSEKAASLFVAKNAEAFSSHGINIELVIPKRLSTTDTDPYLFYNLENKFTVKYLPVVDLFMLPFVRKIASYIVNITFSAALLFYFTNTENNSIIYSNEPLPLLAASLVKRNVFYEMHDFPEKNFWLYTLLFKRVKGVVIHNKWKRDQVIDRWPSCKDKILVEQNAVEVNDYAIPVTKLEARKKLSLPEAAKIIIYTGHLYGWKGVDTLAEAVKSLPSFRVYFVGGTEKDTEFFKAKYAKYENVKVMGYRRHSEIPTWQKAADILVLPNSSKENISKYYTSPMKLYEYLASGRPIIASRLPSIEEIVSEETVAFFKADDSKDLSDKIEEVYSQVSFHDPEQQLRLARQHSWLSRSKRILSFMESKTNK
jgi:glycosyltransferase involved in cell wall biosynthesis